MGGRGSLPGGGIALGGPLRAGDLLEIRPAEEILATLDADGRLDGMPFMPEMLQFCGRRVRVESRAHKTCDSAFASGYRRLEDTVHLRGLRCDGGSHGGCQAACLLFWKTAWLRRVEADGDGGAPGAPAPPAAAEGASGGERAAALLARTTTRRTAGGDPAAPLVGPAPVRPGPDLAQRGPRRAPRRPARPALQQAPGGEPPLPPPLRADRWRPPLPVRRRPARRRHPGGDARPPARRARPDQAEGGDRADARPPEPQPRAALRRGDEPLLRADGAGARARRADHRRAERADAPPPHRLHHPRGRDLHGPVDAVLSAADLRLLAGDLAGAGLVGKRRDTPKERW